jgi:hypothetical protein
LIQNAASRLRGGRRFSDDRRTPATRAWSSPITEKAFETFVVRARMWIGGESIRVVTHGRFDGTPLRRNQYRQLLIPPDVVELVAVGGFHDIWFHLRSGLWLAFHVHHAVCCPRSWRSLAIPLVWESHCIIALVGALWRARALSTFDSILSRQILDGRPARPDVYATFAAIHLSGRRTSNAVDTHVGVDIDQTAQKWPSEASASVSLTHEQALRHQAVVQSTVFVDSISSSAVFNSKHPHVNECRKSMESMTHMHTRSSSLRGSDRLHLECDLWTCSDWLAMNRLDFTLSIGSQGSSATQVQLRTLQADKHKRLCHPNF